jgi:hypothetical protein
VLLPTASFWPWHATPSSTVTGEETDFTNLFQSRPTPLRTVKSKKATMKTMLLGAVVALGLSSTAFAAEGFNPNDSSGVPPGFTNGTVAGNQAQAVARYFVAQGQQLANNHGTPGVVNTQARPNRNGVVNTQAQPNRS